jgi:hypothetical protein
MQNVVKFVLRMYGSNFTLRKKGLHLLYRTRLHGVTHTYISFHNHRRERLKTDIFRNINDTFLEVQNTKGLKIEKLERRICEQT